MANKVLEILMHQILIVFCSFDVPTDTLAGWVTTSVPGSWIRAQKETLSRGPFSNSWNSWSN